MENKKLEKLVDIIKSKKLLITLLIATFFIFASTFWYPFVYFAAIILAIGIVFLSFNETFCLFIYISMFGCFLVPFIASIAIGFVIIAIKYVLDVKKGRVEFLKTPFIVTTILSIVFSLIHYEIDSLGLYQGILIVGFLYFIYFVVAYRKQLSMRKCFDYLFLGLMISIALSLILYFIPTCETLVFDDKLGYIMVSMKQRVAFIDGEYARITLLSFHVNHLSAFCLFAMAFSSIIVLTKKAKTKKEYIYYTLMYFINLVVGLLTLSKAFIVVFAFEVVATVIYYIVTHKKQALKIIGITFAVLLFFCIVFRQRFTDIFERFFVYNYDTLLGMLTTGRSGIWQQYANALLESPIKLLFGFGFFSKEVLLIGPHNFYIFILYRFGLIGILGLVYLVYSYYKSIKTCPRFSLKHSLILLTFLVIGLQEACMDERFIFFIIGIALTFLKDKKPEQSHPAIEQKTDAKDIETIISDDKITQNNNKNRKVINKEE